MDAQDVRGWRETLAHLWLVAVGPRRDARYDELMLPSYGNILRYLGEMAGMSPARLSGEINGWSEQTVAARWITLSGPVWKLVQAEENENWWINERKRLLKLAHKR